MHWILHPPIARYCAHSCNAASLLPARRSAALSGTRSSVYTAKAAVLLQFTILATQLQARSFVPCIVQLLQLTHHPRRDQQAPTQRCQGAMVLPVNS